ncbi:class I SAM-dependent methyltransferase [Paraneptunicella aestuarii]|uniref:class I SAM-dependent methyltransferase n=1 Tax=Paraneptunicella aestuarii TaxID=2831148 RepID=UPI001E303BA8|nr:class I SAM-dependent methyltransferase [Paraneptunicella aestuarii]UAA38677.1 class I SAM-dependent methyltransferase [Paraneptunicella aestuarii]
MTKTIQFWDKMAIRSEKQNDSDEGKENKTIDRTIKHLNSEQKVLDFGCGIGGNTCDVAEHVQHVDAFDYSPESIEVSKRKAQRRGIANVDFAVTDLYDERYQEEGYDVVIAYNILHLIDAPEKAVQRINKLLKPGGLLISATGCLGEKKSFFRMFLSLLSKIGVVPPMTSFSIAELENLVTRGSFEILETEVLDKALTDYFLVAKKQ